LSMTSTCITVHLLESEQLSQVWQLAHVLHRAQAALFRDSIRPILGSQTPCNGMTIQKQPSNSRPLSAHYLDVCVADRQFLSHSIRSAGPSHNANASLKTADLHDSLDGVW